MLTEWGGEERATYVGVILGEKGIGRLMEWGGEEGATVCCRYCVFSTISISYCQRWAAPLPPPSFILSSAEVAEQNNSDYLLQKEQI